MKNLLVFVFLLLPGLAVASDVGRLVPAHTNLTDAASLQRGAKLFVNYCLSCHSARYMRYSRVAADLGLTQEQVEKNLLFTGAKFGEPMTVAMSSTQGAAWFGTAPPDLSVTARARGVDWVYNYLKSFYLDESRPGGWNNTVLPGASMPNVLWELQGPQAAVTEPREAGANGKPRPCDSLQIGTACFVRFEPVSAGTLSAPEFDRAARDIATFLQYVAEPAALERQKYGVWVVLFLAFLTFLTWRLKKEFWRDVH